MRTIITLLFVFAMCIFTSSFSAEKPQGIEDLSVKTKINKTEKKMLSRKDKIKKGDIDSKEKETVKKDFRFKKTKVIKKNVKRKKFDKIYLIWAKSLSFEERFYLAKSWYIVATAYKSAKREEKYQRAYRRAIAIFPEIERLYTPYEKNSKK